MKTIVLNGNDLTRHQVIDIACNHATVQIDISKLSASRAYIVNKVEAGEIIYGVTTGFGSRVDVAVAKEDAEELQKNLLRSHATGLGDPFSVEIVRAIMAIRLNTLLKGHSGVRAETVKQLAFLLNNKVHPVIPQQGSVGASGDLCPLSHMALPLIGEGEVEYNGQCYATAGFLQTKEAEQLWSEPVPLTTDAAEIPGLQPKSITLSYKEGLALNNGTTVMAAVAVIALHKAERLLKVGTLTSALLFEALCARGAAFNYDPIHEARGHQGQTDIARWLKTLLSGSHNIDIQHNEIIKLLLENNEIEEAIRNDLQPYSEPNNRKQTDKKIVYTLRAKATEANNYGAIATMVEFAIKKWKPQDAYSIRCLPQVFGASKTAIDHAATIIDNELNAAVDNPLIFAEDDMVVSGGNFHGQPLALVMDYLKLALAEMGNITERQINKLVDSNTNDLLPSFLVNGSGLYSGLMITQYAAASLVSENKVLVHPASADSIPTCENTEDHVSMGTIAARQAVEIANNVEKITAIAIQAAYYAVTLRMQQFKQVNMEPDAATRLAKPTFDFYNTIPKVNTLLSADDFLEKDRFLSPELNTIIKGLDELYAVAQRWIG